MINTFAITKKKLAWKYLLLIVNNFPYFANYFKSTFFKIIEIVWLFKNFYRFFIKLL